MKIKILLCLGMALMAMTAIPFTASAADFKFRVRVNIEDINDRVTDVKVKCRVFGPGKHLIGGRSYKVPLNARAFAGRVTFTFDAMSGRDPAEANSYKCQLVLWRGSRSKSGLDGNNSSCNNPDANWACAQPGSIINTILEGPIN